jgi:RNA polymerase sigma-70 factor (ECF subfamily)
MFAVAKLQERCFRERWRPWIGVPKMQQSDDTIEHIKANIPHLRRYARLLCSSPDLADDLVQDCLLRAIRKLDTFEPGTNLRAWLFTILANHYRTELRRLQTYRAIDPIAIRQRTSSIEQPSQPIDLATLRDALSGLSDSYRQILLLCGVEGLTYEEAAAVMGVPIGTVRSRLSRARAVLRKALQ